MMNAAMEAELGVELDEVDLDEEKAPEDVGDIMEMEALSDEPAATADDDGRPTILLADDSELALAIITEQLQSAGYRVLTAVNGKEAIALAREERPDLLVLDGLMPGATGFDVCRTVKKDVYPEDPPNVLILSAIYTKRRQKTEAMSVYGVDDVIAKSTDNAALLTAVQRYVGSRSGSAEA
jgi:CheY-like chemotaxis protein